MKRYILVTAIVLSVALIAAGCRSEGNQPTTAPTTMPTTAPATQAATQPATQATEPSAQPTTATGLPGEESIGSTGAGENEPTSQNNARGAMPRGF